jgi:Tfp pilus assembly protein PilN
MRPVNLLPDQHRRRAPGQRPGSGYVALGVLGVLLVMLLAYAVSSNQVNDRKTQTAETRQKADKLEAESRGLSPFANFAQVKQTRLASVRELAKGRFDWERLMRELSLILPRGSWLRSADASVTGDVEGATTTGTATAASGETASAGPTVRLTGCTTRQAQVARMMLRLRQLHRVSGVELVESKQDEAGTTASADSCGRLYAFDLVVTFDPAPVGDEVPPGRKNVPATLGGGS